MTFGVSNQVRNLAARLGYGPDDRLLIVNCDDLGSSHSANIATFRSMVYGVATSATLMVPCPWAREAAQMFEGFPIGVHLTLTSEHGGYRWRGLTNGVSLSDDEGFFPNTTKVALRRITEADARAECRAQIETALSWGVDVTHLDTHMNVMQARTDLYEIYLDLAEEFRLPVRMFSRKETEKQAFRARDRAKARDLLFNEHIVYPWPRRTRDVLFEEIPKLPPGVSEIFAHPVLDGEELRAYDTKNADIRTHDAVCLTDPTVSDLLDQHNIKRISFRELRELQRAGG
ncbi:MAG TPA: ChbG/HpnK family deacetylase [Acetobacteraceae bacterium]|jgi:chitin disaccharide deacetylase|nr:ChbG/HpnK family deacetylase [Acetobacteraceae bacterium]